MKVVTKDKLQKFYDNIRNNVLCWTVNHSTTNRKIVFNRHDQVKLDNTGRYVWTPDYTCSNLILQYNSTGDSQMSTSVALTFYKPNNSASYYIHGQPNAYVDIWCAALIPQS